MPRLRNAGHEKYAQGLAEGKHQLDAYKEAGYTPDKGAASRLANNPKVKKRIEEIKLEKYLSAATRSENEQKEAVAALAEKTDLSPEELALLDRNFTRLSEMGITIWWIASKYKDIFTKALKANNFTAATKAVENLEKMLKQEAEAGEKGLLAAPVAVKEDSKVSLKDVTALLREMKSITQQRSEIVDITPPAENYTGVNPAALLHKTGPNEEK